MSQGDLFAIAMQRPIDYKQLPPAIQWAVDKALGILDWDGSCPHQSGSSCKDCEAKYARKFMTEATNESKQKPNIQYGDFDKLDLRTATITACEAIPKADRLWKLTLDVGELGPRVIAAGIKLAYPNPALLIGKQIVIVANLEPATVKGVRSEGMLLAVGHDDKTLVRLLTSDVLAENVMDKAVEYPQSGSKVG